MIDSPAITQTSLRESFEANRVLETSDPRKAISIYEELVILAETVDAYEIQVDCLLRIVPLSMRQGFYSKAVRQGRSALQLINFHFPEDTKRLAYCYKELGAAYTNGFGKNSLALEYFFKAIKCDCVELNVNLYNNIGSLYKDAQLYDKALKYLEKGRAIADDKSVIMVFILENLSIVYSKKGAYAKAEKLLRKGLEIADEVAKVDESVYYIKGLALNTLGQLLHETNRTSESFEYINEALITAKKKNHTGVIIESLMNKGNFALALRDEALFKTSIKEAIAYSQDEALSTLHISCLESLKKYHWNKKEFEESCLIANQIISVKDRIEKAQENNSMVELLEEQESEIFLLENKNKMINRQKDELEQFAYIVAHDLKEPLRNIGGFGSLINKRYNDVLDDDGKEFLRFIVKSSTHMYTMLEDLLQYATLDSTESNLELIEPKEVIENILYHAKSKIESTNTKVNFSNLNLPVKIRKVHLNILFDNLIKNAVKFKDEGRDLVMDIQNKRKGDKVVFSVKDNGKGIDPKYHISIFQIFKRLEKNKHKGTGIGLSVCKKIVENYQGRIWVESEPGVGTTFFFTIKTA